MKSLAGIYGDGQMSLRAGDPLRARFRLRDRNGRLINMSGRAFALAVRRGTSSTPEVLVNGSGDVAGVILSLSGEQTSALFDVAKASAALVYDVIEQTAAGRTTRLTRGVTITRSAAVPAIVGQGEAPLFIVDIGPNDTVSATTFVEVGEISEQDLQGGQLAYTTPVNVLLAGEL